MKGLFPEYENNRAVDYEKIWANSLFVFDTNVLLNLYRYRVGTRQELLAVLDRISGQIWIPYQVALEFQRNRISVLAEQIKRFSEVKRTVEKAQTGLVAELAKLKLQERHSLINPQPLIEGFEQLVQNFFNELEDLQRDQQTLTGDDLLKDRLEDLFDGRVGVGYTKQADLDVVQKEAEIRYKFNIPPGYEDGGKDSKGPDEYMHGGLIYKSKYGDFIIWRQMLEHCKSSGHKTLIFITDDAKEDWWRLVDLDGTKTIGPRAELIDEARRIGNIDQFLMYSPDKFLNYANKALQAKVSEATIQEVKDISLTRIAPRRTELMELSRRGILALKTWILSNPDTSIRSMGESEIVAVRSGKSHIYRVAASIPLRTPVDVYDRTERMLASTIFGSPDDDLDIKGVTVVWITKNPDSAAAITSRLLTVKNRSSRTLGTNVIVAILDDPETLESGFFIQAELEL